MLSKIQIIERQNNALHKLNEIAAISKADPKETLREALIVGKEYYGLEFAIVSHILGEEYTIEVQSSPTETLYDGQIFALGLTYCKTTLEIDDILVITDVTQSKYVGHPCHKEFSLVSYIGAPIRVNEQVYGTINFSSPYARKLEYDEIDISFIRLLARWAGAYLERQQALDELTESEKKLRSLYELSPLGIVLNDMDGHFEEFNNSFQTICGYSENELKELDYWQLTPEKYESEEALQLESLEKTGCYGPYEKEYIRKDGSRIQLSLNGVLIQDAKGQNHIWSIVEDISKRRFTEDQLNLLNEEILLAKKRFEKIFENNAAGILVVDENRQIVMSNVRFCEIFGYTKNDLLGQNERIIHENNTSYELFKENFLHAQLSSNYKIEFRLKRKDNESIWCEFLGSQIELADNYMGVVWSVLDITKQKQLQTKLEEQAITDFLTGLYNRRYFTSRLREQIFLIQRNPEFTIALMMFDLDHFKRINDTYGHITGDTVIKEFVNIMKRNLRKTDISGRIGGEEFAVVLPNTSMDNTLILASRIKEEVEAQSIKYDDKYISFTVSIGITMLTCDDIDSDMAFIRADTALYTAKEKGRNRIEKLIK